MLESDNSSWEKGTWSEIKTNKTENAKENMNAIENVKLLLDSV